MTDFASLFTYFILPFSPHIPYTTIDHVLFCDAILVVATIIRSSPPEVFLGKGVLKICSKFTGEHPCRSVISRKLQSSFIEITLRHGCFPVNLLHIFRTHFPMSTFGVLLLYYAARL